MLQAIWRMRKLPLRFSNRSPDAMTRAPVLIVDDNPVNLKLARVLLAGAGYEVRTAGDAEEALDVLKTFCPKLILMDIQLPGMDGLTLTRQLKSDPGTGDEEKARASGCTGYITKPLDTRTFADDVNRHLEAGSGVSHAA